MRFAEIYASDGRAAPILNKIMVFRINIPINILRFDLAIDALLLLYT